MPSANEELRDLFVSRQVGLVRLSRKNVRELARILDRALRDAERDLRSRLELLRILGVDRGPVVTEQVRQAIAILDELLTATYARIGGNARQRLLDLVSREVEYSRAAIRRVTPSVITLSVAIPSAELLEAIVLQNPMQGGQIGAYFARNTKESLVKRVLWEAREEIREAVASGLLRSKGVDEVTRGLMGRLRGLAYNQLRAVVDTATKHVAMEAREAFLRANAGPDGVVKGYQWLSTLDLHTTVEYCIPRDGRPYDVDFQPIGHGYEWGAGPGRIHWGCRSSMTSILKSWRELGVDADELTGAQRASMDGQVPSETNIRDFLANRQWTEGELEDMFGVRRAARIEAGEITIRGALRQIGVYA